MRVLITGATGMAGSHLAEYILRGGPQKDGLGGGEIQLYGLYRWRSRMDNLEDLTRQGALNVIEANVSSAKDLAAVERSGALNLVLADVADSSSVRRVVAATHPDRIFHLAAQSFVPASWNAPAETFNINVIGQIHLFEAIREANLDPLVHIAGSSEEYGLVYPEEVPIKETNPLRPLSPYAVSKVAQELLAWQYFKSYGLKTVVTRGFNHTGPRRGHLFVTSTIAKQIAEIEANLRPPHLSLGDLEVTRDWSDVRDVVRGYWIALDKGVPGEVYNVGSGKPTTLGQVIDILVSLSHKSKIEVRSDPTRFRPSDVKMLWADCSKFCLQTGWAPAISLTQTLKDLLEYWRVRVNHGLTATPRVIAPD